MTARTTLRFTRLSLQNWRNFKAIDIALQKRAFLVGANASGKSNLLDAIRFLRDLAVDGGGLQRAVSRRGGITSIRSLAARRYPHIILAASVGNDQSEDLWRYEIEFTHDSTDRRNRRPIIVREEVWGSGKVLRQRPDSDDAGDRERLRQTHLEQVSANREFRPLVEFLRSIQYLHIVPQLVREPDRSVGKTDDPFGGDFMERLAKSTEKARTARLKRMEKALQIAVPQLSALKLSRDPIRRTWHLEGRYDHWRARGARQTEERFSDGTLRLLGLLWALQEHQGPLLLEEPELSLHPAVASEIPRMFARMQSVSGRQVLVTTHSEHLLEDRGIGDSEVFVLTPGPEGTEIRPAGAIAAVKALVEGGLSIGEAVLPEVAPAKAHRLPLFDLAAEAG